MKKEIIVVGGGFAGLEFIKRMEDNKHYHVTLVDVNNYNFFPPLLYQVSTGFMEPSAISYPFRKILQNKENLRFRLGELKEVVPERKMVVLGDGVLHYDILVMATGTVSNFFGNKNIERYSLPMKTISDALSLRNTILLRLDKATRLEDRSERKKLLSFAVAGAGPTGVELSGILAEMRSTILKKDYPELADEDLGDIFLIDGNDAVLALMSENAQRYAYEKLRQLGVEVLLNRFVKDFVDETVYLSDGTTISTKNLIWAAGVRARQFDGFRPESLGSGGRLKTNAYNLVEGYDNIYALGDCAVMKTDTGYPAGHPQLAQPAMQQARNLAINFGREKSLWRPFTYNDKGSLAIIGRNKAVLDFPRQMAFVSGFTAWLIWIFVHITGLVNFKNKVTTLLNWIGYYIYKDQIFRMIFKPSEREREEVNPSPGSCLHEPG